MNVTKIVLDNINRIVRDDRRNIFYLVYYSAIEAVLVLSIPLASSFVINSVLAHASISLLMLGFVVIILFILVTMLQVIKEYIIENFQQRVFLKTGIKVASMATGYRGSDATQEHGKYMNYFFDIAAIQKFFPILLLDGVGLAAKIVVSLVLLLVFDPVLFGVGLFFFSVYFLLLLLLGRNGIDRAVQRSDAKHSAIYYLQHIREQPGTEQEVLGAFDRLLERYAVARQKLFRVTIRQLALTFFTEGFIFSSFLIAGGYLVINGSLPLGEFIAAEIIVVSITSALKGVVKQIDYIYDTVEGFYKVQKLSDKLQEKSHG
jgi:ABC-type bacteriocin/lantibiotic exporter with double-glycine peptidase domain